MKLIKERFEKAIEELHEENKYLAAEVTKLGYPSLSEEVPTAGVAWDKDKKKVIFLFNPNFANTVNDKEFKFTVCHESMHILNSHIFLIRDELEKMKIQNKTNKEISNFKKRINIAADCVVNDSLVSLYGMEKVFIEEGKFKIFYGKETVGMDCHELTAMDVYYLLPEEGNSSNVENHNEWDSFFNSDGTVDEDFVNSVKEFIQDNIQNSSLTEEEAEKIDEIKDKMKNSTDVFVAKAGRDAIGGKRSINRLGKEKINWDKILFQLTSTTKTEDVWTKPNRKLQAVYPNIVLPSCKESEKEKLFVAIDTSGSIDKRALTLFLSILKNTPSRFQIDAITFDTKCYKFDIKKDKHPVGRGGTNFSIIENYIVDNFKKYPRAVFVLTDGEGTPVFPKNPERWCFILYGLASNAYCKDMKYYNIKELLR